MPYAVSGWPNSLDPRPTWYGATGFSWGALPPWKLALSTTGATGNFATLNTEQIIASTEKTLSQLDWGRDGTPTNPVFISLVASLSPEPSGAPPRTVHFNLQVIAAGEDIHFGNAYLVYPHAITGWPSFVMTTTGPGSGRIPNPITVQPRIWNTPATP